jgi:hypothetical protein
LFAFFLAVESKKKNIAGLYIRNRKSELIKINIPSDCIAFQIGETAQIMSGGDNNDYYDSNDYNDDYCDDNNDDNNDDHDDDDGDNDDCHDDSNDDNDYYDSNDNDDDAYKSISSTYIYYRKLD